MFKNGLKSLNQMILPLSITAILLLMTASRNLYISTLGETQLQEFWSQRLFKAEIPISEQVKKNNLRLPKHLVNGDSLVTNGSNF